MNPSNLLDRLYGDNSSQFFDQNPNDIYNTNNQLQYNAKTDVLQFDPQLMQEQDINSMNVLQPLISHNVKLSQQNDPSQFTIPDEHIHNDSLIQDAINESKSLNNKFILELVNNKPLDEEDIPDMDNVILLYGKNLINNLLPDIDYIKYLILLLRLVQIAIIAYILFGWLSPNSLLVYHIWTCIILLIMWELFDDRNIISLLVQKLIGTNDYPRLVQADINFCKYVVLLVLSASLYGQLYPQTSFFVLTKNIFDQLSVYN